MSYLHSSDGSMDLGRRFWVLHIKESQFHLSIPAGKMLWKVGAATSLRILPGMFSKAKREDSRIRRLLQFDWWARRGIDDEEEKDSQHTILTAKRIEGEEGKRLRGEGKVVVCFLGESAIVVPAAWVEKLPIIYKGYVLLFIGYWEWLTTTLYGHARHPCHLFTGLYGYSIPRFAVLDDLTEALSTLPHS